MCVCVCVCDGYCNVVNSVPHGALMAGEMSGDASLIQYSDECNLLHLIAADIFRHQQTGAMHTSF